MVATAPILAGVPGTAVPGQGSAASNVAQVQANLTKALLAAISANPAGLSATLVALPQPDKAILSLAGQLVEAKIAGGAVPQAALRPGATLQLTATPVPPGQTPTLRLVNWQPPGATPDPALARAKTTGAVTLVGQIGTGQKLDLPTTVAGGPAAAPLKAVLVEAAARQTGAGPLLATLQAALADDAKPLPPAVANSARALLGLALDADQPITAQSLRAAIANWTVSGSAQPPSGQSDQAKPGLPPAQLLLRLLSATAQPATLAQTASATAGISPLQTTAPPPPRREAEPILHPTLPAPETLSRLTPEQRLATIATEAARSEDRLLLHQAAPLPTDQPRQQTELPRQLVQSFDLPIMLAGQPMISPFRIERDAPERSHKTGNWPAWSIRFAIDISVFGPVHAHLRLQPMGQQAPRLSLTLWAEQNDSREVLSALSDAFAAELSDNGFDTRELTILGGRPAALPHLARPGNLLDRSS
jgi:hypothetical protein